MIKKTFLLLFTGLSLLSYAQEGSVETKADKKDKKEKKEKVREERIKKEKAPKVKKEKPEQSSDEEETSVFKPETGDISVDFTANNLFKLLDPNSDLFELSDDAEGFGGGIRLRYFLLSDLAIRTNFMTSLSQYSGFPVGIEALNNVDANDAIRGNQTMTIQHHSISLGAEKHFSGTDRLDTYAGGELLLDIVSREERLTNIDTDGNIAEGYRAVSKGGLIGEENIDLGNSDAIRAAAGTGIGVRAFVGADFYVFPKVYLGVELGTGFVYKFIADYKLDEVNPSNQLIVSNRGKVMSLNPDITGQFRVGFRL